MAEIDEGEGRMLERMQWPCVRTVRTVALAIVLTASTACAGRGTQAVVASPAPSAVASPQPTACQYVRQVLPDPTCTPGAADPHVTQDTIHQTICVAGYSSSVRPVVSFTNRLKLQQMALYGASGSPSNYEEDHLISLELGGAPADPANLWPEPGQSPNPKDQVENRLHQLVCSGAMALLEAQHHIATDWTTALPDR